MWSSDSILTLPRAYHLVRGSWPRALICAVLVASVLGKLANASDTIDVFLRVWQMSRTIAVAAFGVLLATEATLLVTLLSSPGRRALAVTALFIVIVSISPIRQLLANDHSSCGCGVGSGGGDHAPALALVRNTSILLLCLQERLISTGHKGQGRSTSRVYLRFRAVQFWYSRRSSPAVPSAHPCSRVMGGILAHAKFGLGTARK